MWGIFTQTGCTKGGNAAADDDAVATTTTTRITFYAEADVVSGERAHSEDDAFLLLFWLVFL